MKTLRFKNVYAIIAILAGIVSAFSFKSIKEQNAMYIGYINLNGNCIETDVLCTDMGSALCKSGAQNLYGLTLGGTICALQLYRIP